MTSENSKVLIVFAPPVEQAVQDVETYVLSNGTEVPDTAVEMPLDEFMAIGRVEDCTCGQISCVCNLLQGHTKKCSYRLAIECPIGIACEDHRRDVCPICDVCDCGGTYGKAPV